jgi:hypothetical protein
LASLARHAGFPTRLLRLSSQQTRRINLAEAHTVAELSEALSDLATALARRVETAPDADRAARAEQLRRDVAEYLAPRAADLSAPLVVVLLGSTGVDKSGLPGDSLSESGLIRPRGAHQKREERTSTSIRTITDHFCGAVG